MNETFINLLEQIKSSTDETEIVEAFENAFNTSDTISEALEEVEQQSIKQQLDITEVTNLTNAFRKAFSKDELDKELFLTNLNGFDIDTRFIDVQMLKDMIENIGLNHKDNKYYHYESDRYFNDSDIKRHIRKTINESLITDKIETWMRENYGEDVYIKTVIGFVTNQIRDNNQYQSIKYISTPFEDSSSVSFKNQVMNIKFNDLFPVVPEYHYNDEIIKDYKEHFADLDVLLEFILAARFGADRKRAYIWFRAESDWGKSFLFKGVLGELKLSTLITESELKKAYSGTPSGFTTDMFTHSWILFIDEFKSAVSEIKNITHELIFTPKGKAQVTVPVYAKIFSSAENVSSLSNDGMIEQQFKNRITFWTEKGVLTIRPAYENNQMLYTKVLTTYAFEYLDRRAQEYIALGEIEASKHANKVLKDIVGSKAVDTVSVEDAIQELIGEFKENYTEYHELDDFCFEHNGNIYITNKGKFIEVFLDKYYAEDSHKTIKHKDKDVILDILDSKRTKHRVNGTTKSGYLWIKAKAVESSIDNDDFGIAMDSLGLNVA